MHRLSLYTCLIIGLAACGKDDASSEQSVFEEEPVAYNVLPNEVDEASGIADSKTHPGHLWLHEDSGNPTQLVLMSHTGEIKKRVRLRGISNRDWEEMAIARGPVHDINYVYLADIGNNNVSVRPSYIYRFPEPGIAAAEVGDIERITFNYPDKPHDAEAMLVESATRDIYIFSKEDSVSSVYKLPYPQSTTTANRAELVGQLPFHRVTGAAFSPAGDEVLIKTYSSIYYWKVGSNPFINDILSKQPIHVSYVPEPQGEAITFTNDAGGFFTISERPRFINDVKLYFYKRK